MYVFDAGDTVPPLALKVIVTVLGLTVTFFSADFVTPSYVYSAFTETLRCSVKPLAVRTPDELIEAYDVPPGRLHDGVTVSTVPSLYVAMQEYAALSPAVSVSGPDTDTETSVLTGSITAAAGQKRRKPWYTPVHDAFSYALQEEVQL